MPPKVSAPVRSVGTGTATVSPTASLRGSVTVLGSGAAVKADAYGIGLGPAMRALAREGARTFFVARLEEAIRARQALPDATVYVLDGLLGDPRVYCEHGLRPDADEVHFDPAPPFVEKGTVSETIEVEVAAQLAVNAGQEVEVERRRHAPGVVVGRVEDPPVLLEVDADEQPAPGANESGDSAQQGDCLGRTEVANGRPREEDDPTF